MTGYRPGDDSPFLLSKTMKSAAGTDGNFRHPIGATTDRLFYSPAFIAGFADARAGRPLRHPDGKAGPNPTVRSAQLAYERGRQFAVLWGNRSVCDLAAMKAALQRYHDAGLIT